MKLQDGAYVCACAFSKYIFESKEGSTEKAQKTCMFILKRYSSPISLFSGELLSKQKFEKKTEIKIFLLMYR